MSDLDKVSQFTELLKTLALKDDTVIQTKDGYMLLPTADVTFPISTMVQLGQFTLLKPYLFEDNDRIYLIDGKARHCVKQGKDLLERQLVQDYNLIDDLMAIIKDKYSPIYQFVLNSEIEALSGQPPPTLTLTFDWDKKKMVSDAGHVFDAFSPTKAKNCKHVGGVYATQLLSYFTA